MMPFSVSRRCVPLRPLQALCVLLLLTPCVASAAEALCFDITLDAQVAQAPITGRLFVLTSQSGTSEPRFGPNWFKPEPFFGLDVRNFAPGEARRVDDSADGFPDRLSKLPPGKYRVQAVLDHSFDQQHHGKAAGNVYSAVAELNVDPAAPPQEPIRLVLNQVVPEAKFPDSQWVREVKLRSDLLSKFHGREVVQRCAVILPAGYYSNPQRRFPVVYIIPGFSGTHRDALRYSQGGPAAGEGEVELIRVMLNADCKWGHHVFADSATNGPRGQALVEELVPHIDATFRTVAAPTARYLNGHSSGGWSSLWLQVTYPETFGGVWSTSPDPVTFSDYQQVDLYASPPQSLYFDAAGQRRPIARNGATPVLWYESFGRMDDVIGRGGQLRSFEAVFSPLDEQGQPRKLWDRQTGKIDPEVARAWEAYDIRLKLERNWEQLGPKLEGKLHVTTGSLDTFYLDGAVAQLAESLERLGSDAEVTILAGESHSSLLTPELYRKMRRQMTAAYLKHHGEAAAAK